MFGWRVFPKLYSLARAKQLSEATWTRQTSTFAACVVGSGPAGFYAASQLLRWGGSNIKVDILDRLPTPFGLVRSGVAPDHPDTKNVINQYTQTAMDDRVSFYGHVRVGSDISVDCLRKLYHAVVLAFGAESSIKLNVPGEDLAGVISAREFVWWYNGHPEHTHLPVNLSTVKRVAICGMGNVALDCARILLQPPDRLAATDIAAHALNQLRASSVERVDVIGRRGPVQASFTAKELRELLNMDGVGVVLDPSQMQPTPVDEAEMKKSRAKRRIFDIMQLAANRQSSSGRHLHLRFLRSLKEIQGDGRGAAAALLLECNQLQPAADGSQRPVGIGITETLPVDLVMGSIGYRSLPLPGTPFDARRGIIPNREGRVLREGADEVEPGLYVCGWVKRGPSGIIGTNLTDAQETVAAIAQDASRLPPPSGGSLRDVLQRKGVQAVSFADWLKLDAAEVARGHALGKPREKALEVAAMLDSLRTPLTKSQPAV